jgi:hypothetical protein
MTSHQNPGPGNHSLFTGIFPDGLKISAVRPQYKKGYRTSMSNYRPISLFTTFYKVLEKVMHNGLSYYLQINNILLVPEQFGFSKGISTENAAFKLTDSVLKSINKKMHVGEIFCDLAKAFDCVNHKILLTKLHFFLAFKEQQQVCSFIHSFYLAFIIATTVNT